MKKNIVEVSRNVMVESSPITPVVDSGSKKVEEPEDNDAPSQVPTKLCRDSIIQAIQNKKAQNKIKIIDNP